MVINSSEKSSELLVVNVTTSSGVTCPYELINLHTIINVMCVIKRVNSVLEEWCRVYIARTRPKSRLIHTHVSFFLIEFRKNGAGVYVARTKAKMACLAV